MLWIMRQRTATVLESAIKEFIRFGKPVSSELLFEKGDFGVKPATIRAELNHLTEDGFLTQPHTSGGRVPTDRGYEFFVNQLVNELPDRASQTVNLLENLADNFLEGALDDFIRDFSDQLRLLTIGYQFSENGVYKSGLDNLFASLDLDSKADFYEVAKDFEDIEERARKLKRFAERLNMAPAVFIGKKSPVTRSRHLAVIADCYEIDNGSGRFLLMAVGSKRMDYKKNIATFRALRKKLCDV